MDFFYITSAFFASYFAYVYNNIYLQASSPFGPKKNLRMNTLYLVIYLSLGLLYSLVAPRSDLSALDGMMQLVLLYTLFLIAIIDIQLKIIPNTLIIFLLIVRTIFLAVQLVYTPEQFKTTIFGALIGLLIGGGIILVAMILSKNSIGAGDAKMFATIGFFIGMDVLSVFFFTFAILVFVSLILIILKKVTLKDAIPLAPFAFTGTLLFYLLS